MSRPGAIEAHGDVIELRPGGICQVELANGHRLWARPSGHLRRRAMPLAVGDRVALELSPFDVTRGKIIAKLDTEHESTGISQTAV